jgi:hypothetical protein
LRDELTEVMDAAEELRLAMGHLLVELSSPVERVSSRKRRDQVLLAYEQSIMGTANGMKVAIVRWVAAVTALNTMPAPVPELQAMVGGEHRRRWCKNTMPVATAPGEVVEPNDEAAPQSDRFDLIEM